MRQLILICLILGLCTSALYAEDKPDPREKIDTMISETIRLIEAKDTAALVKFVLPPKELQRKLEKKTLEELTKEVEPQLPIALKMLKQVQGLKPRMNEDETQAVYELPEQIEGQKEVKFFKEDKFWYIK